MMRHATLTRLAVLAAGAACAGACGPGELEIRGERLRTVGERVTLKLLQGEQKFSGKLTLVDLTTRAFAEDLLAVSKPDDRTLELTVPTEVTVGEARLDIAQQGSSDRYHVPLELSRLALTLDVAGKLETLPLPGSSMARGEVATGDVATAMSLAPGGGLLAVLTADRVRAFTLGATPRALIAAPAELPGAAVVAATDRGAVVATAEVVVVYELATSGATEQARFALPGVRGLSVDAASRRAAAVRGCDTDGDLQPDADCLSLIELDGPSSHLGPEIKLDDQHGAALVALRADGSAAIVADDEKIYGVLLEVDPPEVSDLRWPAPATPVGIDRAPSSLGDIFAIGDGAASTIQIVGFDGPVLKPVGTRISLAGAPAGLSFGRLIDLYAAVGDKLFRIDPYETEPKPVELPGTTSGPIVGLAVQH